MQSSKTTSYYAQKSLFKCAIQLPDLKHEFGSIENFYYYARIDVVMKVLLYIFLIPLILTPVFAQINTQTLPTEKGTLNVELSTIPAQPTPEDIIKFKISFINPNTEKIQEHIDYRLTLSKDGVDQFGPIPLTHTSTGSVTIPVELQQEGTYSAKIEVEGILFQPIPKEAVTFDILVGEASAQTPTPSPAPEENGGCLIATATFGSEMSSQVQELREIRDNVVLQTESGLAFMSGFNQFYYLVSPPIADLERQNPIFKESIKFAITPLLSSLSILEAVEIDSEGEMLGYGIGVILLNIGIYFGIPSFAILMLYQFRRK